MGADSGGLNRVPVDVLVSLNAILVGVFAAVGAWRYLLRPGPENKAIGGVLVVVGAALLAWGTRNYERTTSGDE